MRKNSPLFVLERKLSFAETEKVLKKKFFDAIFSMNH